MTLKKIDSDLVESIKRIVANARKSVYQRINNELMNTYWLIGKEIVDMERKNNNDNQTSRQIILELSKQLTEELGRGFSRSNLFNMSKLYLEYPSDQSLTGHLTWTHRGFENNLFALKYTSILPDKKKLIEEVKHIIEQEIN